MKLITRNKLIEPTKFSLYTDGGYSAKVGKITTGFALLEDTHIIENILLEGEQSYNGHSSYQAESVAIWNGLAAAVDFFGENKPQFENHSSLNILTDSMSLLQHLEKLQFHQMMISQPIQEIVRCLGLATDKLFKSIIFAYVPGHKGLAMNEYVDALASTQLGKHTLHMPPETDDLQIPYSVLKSSFRNRTNREFKRYLEGAVTQSRIRSNPSRHNFKKPDNHFKTLPRKIGVRWFRILSGHCLTKSYRYRFKFEDTEDDICDHCNERPETIQHILQECPALTEMYTARRNFEGRADGRSATEVVQHGFKVTNEHNLLYQATYQLIKAIPDKCKI